MYRHNTWSEYSRNWTCNPPLLRLRSLKPRTASLGLASFSSRNEVLLLYNCCSNRSVHTHSCSGYIQCAKPGQVSDRIFPLNLKTILCWFFTQTNTRCMCTCTSSLNHRHSRQPVKTCIGPEAHFYVRFCSDTAATLKPRATQSVAFTQGPGGRCERSLYLISQRGGKHAGLFHISVVLTRSAETEQL